MSDIEQAKSLMRIVRRDFNAVLGMANSPLFGEPCLNRSDVIRKLGALLAHVDSVIAAANAAPKA